MKSQAPQAPEAVYTIVHPGYDFSLERSGDGAYGSSRVLAPALWTGTEEPKDPDKALVAAVARQFMREHDNMAGGGPIYRPELRVVKTVTSPRVIRVLGRAVRLGSSKAESLLEIIPLDVYSH